MKMLGRRLLDLRTRNAFSQGQVAEYAKVAQTSYSALERGVIQPKTVDAIVQLAKFYGVSADYLLGMTDDPRPAATLPFPAGGDELLAILGSVSEQTGEEIVTVARSLAELDAQRKRDNKWVVREEQARSLLGDDAFGLLIEEMLRAGRSGRTDDLLARLNRTLQEEPSNHDVE